MKAPSALLTALIVAASAAPALAQSEPAAQPARGAPAANPAVNPARPANGAPPPPVRVYLPAEQEYSGGPVPAGMHLEHRSNALLMGAGATVFLAAYVPFAVDGIWQNFRRREAGVNESTRDEVAIWYTVPVVGPYIYVAQLNQREQARFDQLQQQRMTRTGFHCENTNIQNNDNWCSNAGASQPQSGPVVATTGEWIWATVLAGSQVYGLVMFVAGFLGHRAVVHDPPRASASAGARRASRRATWRLDPGAGPTPVGMTLSVITF